MAEIENCSCNITDKEIIESNWSVKKDDESFVTFEKEFAII